MIHKYLHFTWREGHVPDQRRVLQRESLLGVRTSSGSAGVARLQGLALDKRILSGGRHQGVRFYTKGFSCRLTTFERRPLYIHPRKGTIEALQGSDFELVLRILKLDSPGSRSNAPEGLHVDRAFRKQKFRVREKNRVQRQIGNADDRHSDVFIPDPNSKNRCKRQRVAGRCEPLHQSDGRGS